jgi:hypothetical protein
MKKIFIAALGLIIFSCSSNDKKTTEDKSKNEAGIQTDNGGVPDTTNAIDLSTHKKDTVQNAKDSAK